MTGSWRLIRTVLWDGWLKGEGEGKGTQGGRGKKKNLLRRRVRTMLGGQDPGGSGSGGGGARRRTEVCGAFFNTFLPFFILRTCSFSFNSLLSIPFYWAPKRVRFLAHSAAKNVTVQAGRRRICLVVVRADATRGMFEPQHATTRHTARPPQIRVHVCANKSQGMIMGAAVSLGALSLSGGERRSGVSALREFLSRKVARPIEPYANPNLGRDGDNCQGLFQREKFHC